MKHMGMREFLNKLKQIKEVILKLNRKELISLVNSVNKHYEEYGVTGLSIILDDLIYQPFGEKFFENNFGSKTSAAIAVYKSLVTAKSHFDWTDDYIRLNDFEGVESISEKDLGEKIKDRAEDVAEVILTVGLPQDIDFKGKEEIEKIINEQLKESIETSIYRGEADNSLSKKFGQIDSGKFYGVSNKDVRGWGNASRYKIIDKTKIFDAKMSSDEYCYKNNLYDIRFAEIEQLIKQYTDKISINKLRDFTELSDDDVLVLDKSVANVAGKNFCWYDIWDRCSQLIAKIDLEKKGFGGVKWYHQDFGNPVQYQIWDDSIIKKISNIKEGLKMGYKELSKEQQDKLIKLDDLGKVVTGRNEDGEFTFLISRFEDTEELAKVLRTDDDGDLSDEEVIAQYGDFVYGDDYYIDYEYGMIYPYYRNGLQAFALIDGELYSDVKIKEDDKLQNDYIDSIVNDAKQANTILSDEEIVKNGYIKYNEEAYENGYYGQVDDPKEILKKILEENPDAKVIFSINYATPFATGFDVFVKKGSLKESKEITGVTTINAKWDDKANAYIIPKKDWEDWD